jgi:lipopolysaccharide transport system ATP-binding protein
MPATVVFDRVWKKFRRGERHDSLRDLVPALMRRAMKGTLRDQLAAQEFWALEDVSFEVAPGEALGIIGPNGAGKSTTLKLLTRILKPTRGRCEVRGRVGALIEVAAGFHPDLTGRENIYLQGAIMGMKRPEIARKFDDIVGFAGIDQFVDTPVKRYSSGMNARLGFSIAAHIEPDALFVDEVLSVGDMDFQRRCIERMIAIKRNGTTLVFVSHDLAAVRLMCEKALLLRRGSTGSMCETQEAIQTYVGSVTRARTGMGTRPTRAGEIPEIVDVRTARRGGVMALCPGDRIRVTLRIPARRDRRTNVLVIYIVQQSTQVVAYNANVPLDLGPSRAGAPTEIVVDLVLNLLRGIYSLNFSITDASTQEHSWLCAPLTLGIAELASYEGVAHIPVQVAVVDAAAAPEAVLTSRAS